MPDITVNTRDLDFVSANVKVRLRDPATGKPTVYSSAEILADNTVETVLTDLVAPSANTEVAKKTAYAVDGGGNVLDTEDNIYANTYATGKSIKYTTTDYNSNLFLDVTVE